MNSSTNNSNSRQLTETVKACIYLVDFLVCLVFAIVIIRTISSHSALMKEVRFVLLCHHLIYLTLFFAIGTIFNIVRASKSNAPLLACWTLFAVFIVFGRAILMTVVLMIVNVCIAVCWPLKYLAFVHAVKFKIIACMWIIAFSDPLVTVLYEIINTPERILETDPYCPTTFSGVLSRTAAMVFIIVLGSIVLGSYILIVREGRKAGHFKSSSQQAKRTILIHGLQIVLHFLPTLVNIWLGGKTQYIIFDLTNFIIFSFAQCLSPVVYGLRCTELRQKLTEKWHLRSIFCNGSARL